VYIAVLPRYVYSIHHRGYRDLLWPVHFEQVLVRAVEDLKHQQQSMGGSRWTLCDLCPQLGQHGVRTGRLQICERALISLTHDYLNPWLGTWNLGRIVEPHEEHVVSQSIHLQHRDAEESSQSGTIDSPLPDGLFDALNQRHVVSSLLTRCTTAVLVAFLPRSCLALLAAVRKALAATTDLELLVWLLLLQALLAGGHPLQDVASLLHCAGLI
jgi:hypothetical protein